MAVRFTEPTDEFEYVWITELHILQPRIFNTGETPDVSVSFAYWCYKIEPSNGDMIYGPNIESDYVDGYFVQAQAEYAAGDPTLIQAQLGNQAAVAKLITDATGKATEIV